MKKLVSILFVFAITVFFVSCGKNINQEYVGKWIPVAIKENGKPVSDKEMYDYELNLKSDGKGDITLGVECKSLKWSSDGGSVLKLKINKDTYSADIKDGKAVFKDFLQTGLDITFSPEKNADLSFKQEMQKSDKKLVGTWVSYSVEDVLGQDLSDSVKADGFLITFKDDYTADFKVEEFERKNEKWSMLDEKWGSLDDTDCDLSWDIINDELKVVFYNGKEYLIYFCKKMQR